MMKKTSKKKIRNRKSNASKNMGVKNYRLVHPFMRKRFPIESPPTDYFTGLKKMLFNKTKQMKIGTLTQSLPMGLRLANSFARLPLSSRLLGRHENREERNLSRFTLEG